MGAVFAVLGVLLLILKVVLYILLFVILLAVALLLIFLFVPLGYRARAAKEDGLLVNADIHWLFRLVGARLVWRGGDMLMKLRVLFFTVYTYDPNKQKKVKKVKTVKKKNAEPEPERQKPPEPAAPPAPVKTPAPPEKARKPGICERLSRIFDGVAGFFGSIRRNIRFALDRADDFMYLACQALGIIRAYLKALKPKRVVIRGVVGFDDPSRTGYAVGGAAVISGMLGLDMIISGDFENAVIKGFVEISGRLALISFILPLLKVLLRQRARKLIFGLLKRPKRGKRALPE